jgi:hypothetical protein
MSNENLNESSRVQSLLTEYQVCQVAADTNTSNYWLLASIFIGVSSALLAGTIFAIISNEKLLNLMLYPMVQLSEDRIVLASCGLLIFIGVSMIAIYYFLWKWLIRVRTFNDICYYRMPQIEDIVNTKKSHLIQGFDKKFSKNFDPNNDKEWQSLTLEQWNDIDRINTRFFRRRWYQFFKSKKLEFKETQISYEKPSSGFHVLWIFRILAGLWGVVIIAALVRLAFAIRY